MLLFCLTIPQIQAPKKKKKKKKKGSPTCDMNALIKLPRSCEIRPIYVQIWEEPSVCVGSINLCMHGSGEDGVQLTEHVCMGEVQLPRYPPNPSRQHGSILIVKDGVLLCQSEH